MKIWNRKNLPNPIVLSPPLYVRNRENFLSKDCAAQIPEEVWWRQNISQTELYTEYCDHHVSATICTASGLLANEFCPAETKHTRVYIVGGSSDSDDGAYLLPNDLAADNYCTVHNAASIIPEIPEIPEISEEIEEDEKKDKETKEDKNKNQSENQKEENEKKDEEATEDVEQNKPDQESDKPKQEQDKPNKKRQ